MPLDVNNPPIAAYEAVQSVLSELAGKSEFRTPALRRADPRTLALSPPIGSPFFHSIDCGKQKIFVAQLKSAAGDF